MKNCEKKILHTQICSSFTHKLNCRGRVKYNWVRVWSGEVSSYKKAHKWPIANKAKSTHAFNWSWHTKTIVQAMHTIKTLNSWNEKCNQPWGTRGQRACFGVSHTCSPWLRGQMAICHLFPFFTLSRTSHVLWPFSNLWTPNLNPFSDYEP